MRGTPSNVDPQLSQPVWPAVCRILLVGWLLLVSGAASAWAESVKSIEEFVKQKSKWSTLEGTTLRLEGRYSIFSKPQIIFANCPLEFVMGRDFSRPVGDSRTIEVTGHIDKRENKLLFVVSDVQAQPSDIERMRSLRTKAGGSKAEDFYKAAAWGESRATYYKDDALRTESHEVFRQGVQAEYRVASSLTPALLRGFIAKLASRGIDPPLQQELEHEALWLEYKAILKADKIGRDSDSELVTKLAALPGADQALAPEDQEWMKTYLASPLLEFKDADEALRLKVHRAFFVEVMRNRILRQLSPDGKNGYDIAARLETEVPEFAKSTDALRSQERDYYLGRVAAMTRKEVTELVTKSETRGSPEYPVEIKQRWLAAREKQIDMKSMSAWIELGDDYQNLGTRKDDAVRCYIKAYEISPQTSAISEWLQASGLALHNSRWVPQGDVPKAPDDPLAMAVQQGQVREKMTAQQVRAALGVEPTSKTKVATGQHLQEFWLFEDHGLSIQFTRQRRKEEALVTRVINLSAGPAKPKPFERPRPSGTEGF